ncbi:hypothetical protein Bbelb_344610 [Branchiostoma belcheri]|nr:hypothetical protein Bbelb_344610 [Branchiostoma belcheri]
MRATLQPTTASTNPSLTTQSTSPEVTTDHYFTEELTTTPFSSLLSSTELTTSQPTTETRCDTLLINPNIVYVNTTTYRDIDNKINHGKIIHNNVLSNINTDVFKDYCIKHISVIPHHKSIYNKLSNYKCFNEVANFFISNTNRAKVEFHNYYSTCIIKNPINNSSTVNIRGDTFILTRLFLFWKSHKTAVNIIVSSESSTKVLTSQLSTTPKAPVNTTEEAPIDRSTPSQTVPVANSESSSTSHYYKAGYRSCTGYTVCGTYSIFHSAAFFNINNSSLCDNIFFSSERDIYNIFNICKFSFFNHSTFKTIDLFSYSNCVFRESFNLCRNCKDKSKQAIHKYIINRNFSITNAKLYIFLIYNNILVFNRVHNTHHHRISRNNAFCSNSNISRNHWTETTATTQTTAKKSTAKMDYSTSPARSTEQMTNLATTMNSTAMEITSAKVASSTEVTSEVRTRSSPVPRQTSVKSTTTSEVDAIINKDDNFSINGCLLFISCTVNTIHFFVFKNSIFRGNFIIHSNYKGNPEQTTIVFFSSEAATLKNTTVSSAETTTEQSSMLSTVSSPTVPTESNNEDIIYITEPFSKTDNFNCIYLRTTCDPNFLYKVLYLPITNNSAFTKKLTIRGNYHQSNLKTYCSRAFTDYSLDHTDAAFCKDVTNINNFFVFSTVCVSNLFYDSNIFCKSFGIHKIYHNSTNRPNQQENVNNNIANCPNIIVSTDALNKTVRCFFCNDRTFDDTFSARNSHHTVYGANSKSPENKRRANQTFNSRDFISNIPGIIGSNNLDSIYL